VLFTNAFTYASVVALLPLFAEEAQLGNPGLFFTVFSLVVLVLRAPLGRLSDRLGRVAVIAPGLFMTFVALFVLSRAGSLAVLLVVAVLYAIGVGAAQPTLMAMTIDRAKPRGTAARRVGTFTTRQWIVGSSVVGSGRGWGRGSAGRSVRSVSRPCMVGRPASGGLVGVALLLAGSWTRLGRAKQIPT